MIESLRNLLRQIAGGELILVPENAADGSTACLFPDLGRNPEVLKAALNPAGQVHIPVRVSVGNKGGIFRLYIRLI